MEVRILPSSVTGNVINGSAANTNRSGIRSITINFDQPVTGASAASLQIVNDVTGSVVDLSTATISGNGTSSLTWTLSGVTLADGRYTATLSSGAVSPALSTTYTFGFHKLFGDTSGNGLVSFDDLGLVQGHLGPPPSGEPTGPFRQGDASGEGNVSFNDFGAVQSNFGAKIPPKGINDLFTGVEDGGSIIGSVLANDVMVAGTLSVNDFTVDGSTYSAGSSATILGVGSLSISASGILNFTPVTNFNGSVPAITYTVAEGSRTDTAGVTVTVTPVNDAPVVNDDTFTVAEDGSVSINVLDNDSDVDAGTTLTVTHINGMAVVAGGAAVAVANGSVLLNLDGTLTFSPTANFNGPLSFTYGVSDGTATATATVSGTVLAENDAPVGASTTVTTAEDTAFSGSVLATDVDSASPTYALVGTPSNGAVTLDASTGAYTFTPDVNFNGTASFSWKANDGTADSATYTVTINVTAANDSPVVTVPGAQATNEDSNLAFTVLGGNALTVSDVDGDVLTTIVSIPAGAGTLTASGAAVLSGSGTSGLTLSGTAAQINAALATLIYAPHPDYNTGSGSFNLTMVTTDGVASAVSGTVAITVTPVADVAVTTLSTNEDAATTASVTTGFENPGAVVTSVTQPPLGQGTVTSTATGVTYTPPLNFSGTTSFTYTVTSGGVTETGTVTVTVLPVNDAPVGANSTISTSEDTPKAGLLSASDVDGGPLTYSLVGTPLNGVVTLDASTGVYLFTPNANFNGPGSFSWKANDGAADSPTYTVTIDVTPVNDAPAGVSSTVTTAEDTPKAGLLAATDVDGDGLIYALAGTPSNGTVFLDPVTGVYVFTPASNFSGTGSFSWTVSDGVVTSGPYTVTISVTPVNDAPVGANSAASAIEDNPLSGAVSATDADGNVLTYSVVANPAHGSLTLNGDGTFTYTPSGNYFGLDSFSWKANDGTVDSATYAVSITVAPVNDAPSGADKAITLAEDTSHSFLPGDFGFSDLNDSPAHAFQSVIVSSLPSAGTLTLNGVPVTAGQSISVSLLTGAAAGLVWTPPANANGNSLASFTFQVKDNGGTANGGVDVDASANTVTFNVTPVNDGPVAIDDLVTGIEDSPVTLNLLLNDQNAAGGAATSPSVQVTSLTVNGSTYNTPGVPVVLPGIGSVYFTSAGNLTFTPVQNWNGTVPGTITYTITEGVETSVGAVTITLAPVNDAPVASPDTFTVAEDGQTDINVLGNDTDVEFNPLALTQVNGQNVVVGGTPVIVYSAPASTTVAGTVELLPTGELRFSGAPDYNGQVSFTYTLIDGQGGVATGTVTGVVTPVNDAPVPSPASVTLFDEGALDAVNAQETGGNFEPHVNIDSFLATKLVSGVNMQTLLPLVQAEINAQAGATVASLADAIATVWDYADDNYSYYADLINEMTARLGVEYARYLRNGGKPLLDVVAKYRPDDYQGVVDPGTNPDRVQSLHDNLLGNIDGPSLDDKFGSNPTVRAALQLLLVNNNLVTLSNTRGVFGGYEGETNTALAWDQANGLVPVAGGQMMATDADLGATQTWALVGSSAGTYGDLTLAANGTWSYVLDQSKVNSLPEGALATDTFTVTVSDGIAPAVPTTITITIKGSNDRPVANADSKTVNEDGPVATGSVLNDTDADTGDTLSVTAVNGVAASVGTEITLPSGAKLTLNADGTYTYDPNGAFESLAQGTFGSDSFTYTVRDSKGALATATVTITITGQNDAPVINLPVGPLTVSEDSSSPMNVTGLSVSDTDGDLLMTTLSVSHGQLSVTAIGGATVVDNGSASVTISGTATQINAVLLTLTYQPIADFNGIDTLSISTSDNATTANDAVNITVTPVADAVDDSVSAVEDTGAVTFNVLTGANGGSADTFENAGHSITAFSAGPDLNDDPIVVAAGITTNAYDSQHRLAGTISISADGTLVFTPTPDYFGEVTFTYTVTSAGGTSEDGLVTITVTPVADIVADSVTTNEDTATSFNVLSGTGGAAADSFENTTGPLARSVTQVMVGTAVSGTTVNVTVPSSGSATSAIYDATSPTPRLAGTLSVQADGAILFTPAPNYNGTLDFSYTVTSGGVIETTTVAITVAPVNDAPVIDLNTSSPGSGYSTIATSPTGVAISNGPAVSDIDDTTLASMNWTVGNVLDGDSEILTLAGVDILLGTSLLTPVAITSDGVTFNVVYDADSGILTFANAVGGEMPISAIQSLISASTYRNIATTRTAGVRSISMTISDGIVPGSFSRTATATVSVS